MTDTITIDKVTIKDGYGGEKQVLLGATAPQNYSGTIPLDVYRRIVDESGTPTGYIHRVAGRPVVEVIRELGDVLEREALIDEYFGVAAEYRANVDTGKSSKEWPADVRWIACYAVTGGSEGHYIHVDLIAVRGKYKEAEWTRQSIATGKTFQGMAHAQKIAARCAELLGA